MNQLIIIVCGTGLGIVLTFAGGFYGGEHIEREKSMQERERMQQQSMQALQQATAKNAALEEQFNNQARKSADEYQAKIACLDAQYRTAGTHEMRIAVAGCRPADAGPAATQSAGKSDAASSGTIPPAATAYLPAITQQQLLDLAHDADEQCTRLQTLQDWIRGAGLY